MRKTLYIHIGHFKTGTTALQDFFVRNRKVLARAGLDYATLRINHAKHSNFAFAIYRQVGVTTLMHGYGSPERPADLWAELFDYVRASAAPKVLISSEEFMRLGAFPEAAALLPELVEPARDIDIRIIAYLRPPGSHLTSWYNQLVKMGEDVPDYTHAVTEVMEPVHLDYGLALEPWTRTFGAGAVIVRPYTAAVRADHGLIFDMLSVLGLDLPRRDLDLVEDDPNPRLDPRSSAVAQVMAGCAVPPAMFNNVLSRAQDFFRVQALKAHLQQAAEPDMGAAVERIRRGLSVLEALPRNGVDCDLYARDMPDPDDVAQVDPAELVPFLFSELLLARQNLNQAIGRIAALEEAAAAAGSGK